MKKKSQLQRMKEKEKKLLNEQKKRDKINKEKELKKRVRKLQKEKLKYKLKPYGKVLKKSGKWLDKVTKNLTVHTEASEYGVKIGMIVKITNGQYSGMRMKIRKLIIGGVEGNVHGNIIKIRHGSYKIPGTRNK